MSVAVTRKTILTLVAIGASCLVQAQTYFSGSFNARPFLSNHSPKIQYEVKSGSFVGEVKFKIDVGGNTDGSGEQNETEEVTFDFLTMLESLHQRVNAIEVEIESSYCGVPVNCQSKQVLGEYGKMRTLLEAGLRCELEGDCWNDDQNDISKLGIFKEEMLDKLMTNPDATSNDEDNQAGGSLWDANMSLASVCQLLREYNIGEGVIHAVNDMLKEKKGSGRELQEMKDNYWLWRNYQPSFCFTVEGAQSKLAFARSSSKDSLTGAAKNGYLHEKVHESLKQYMEAYLNERARRHLISVFDKEDEKTPV